MFGFEFIATLFCTIAALRPNDRVKFVTTSSLESFEELKLIVAVGILLSK
ncbi:hypothetical protein J6P52_02220 [bacterium]|nr:hypothetical protein [bacterium]